MTIIKRINNAHLVINIVNNDCKTMILIFPGGGYQLLSNRESGPIATKFNYYTYNTAILYYSCHGLDSFSEAKEALKILSKDYPNIIVVGFSAGGHLAGLLGTEKDSKEYNLKGMVLCYPVITLLDYTHEDTCRNLLLNYNTLDNRIKYSVEKRVDSTTVPTFIWTTKDDETVPYENTLMMIDALKKHNIYHESVIFDHGRHGLALADWTAVVLNDESFLNSDVARWFDMALKFIRKVTE